MRHVVPRLVVVVGLLMVVAPKPSLFEMQRWLDRANEATQNNAPNQNLSHTPDKLVRLLAESEQEGWSNASRLQYAEYRQALGESQAMLALFAFDPDILGDDIIPVLRDLAAVEVGKRNWNAAAEYLDRLVSLEPDDTETNYLLGLITITDDTRRAFSYFDAMDRDSPHTASVNVLREVVLNFSNPVTEADYQTLGLALIEVEEWIFAERAFNAAIAFEQDWLSYTYRGYVRDHIDGMSGFNDYGNALSLAPTSPLVYYFLGLHWRQVDDLDASREAFLNAYFLETTNPAYAVETGRAYQLLGNNIAAEDWFNVAVALEPENVQWQQLRAEFYANEGFALDGDGIAAIQEAYALAPENPDILTSLGYAYLQLEDVDMAQNYLELAITIEPNDARTQYIYGLTMSEQQDGEAAIAAFLQAVEIEGSTTSYGLLAARSLQQLGIALP